MIACDQDDRANPARSFFSPSPNLVLRFLPLAQDIDCVLVDKLQFCSADLAPESSVFSERFFRASDAIRFQAFGTGSRRKLVRWLGRQMQGSLRGNIFRDAPDPAARIAIEPVCA